MLTKIRTVLKPTPPAASIGAQNVMEGKDVQPNQKKDIAKIGAPINAISSRFSGGTGAGLYSATKRV